MKFVPGKTAPLAALMLAALAFNAPAAEQPEKSLITGTVQGPDGAALGGVTVYVCTGLVEARREDPNPGQTKPRMALYYSTAQPGGGKCEGSGKTGRAGDFKVRYPEGKQGDLFAWKAGFDAVIVRNVSAPSDVGALKLPGTNDTAMLDKRNVEFMQQKAQHEAHAQEAGRQRRLDNWAKHEKDYPGGVPIITDYQVSMTNGFNGHNHEEVRAGLLLITNHRIKAKLLTPEGKPVQNVKDAPVRVVLGENLQLEKRTPQKWLLTNVTKPGDFYEDGNLDLLAVPTQPWDICIWAKGYEPLILRNVTAPADLGALKLTTPNTTLEDIVGTHH